MAIFNPALYQPLNIFFDFEIANSVLKRIYYLPNLPIDFTATIKTGLSTFTCSLFDDTGYDVEPYLNFGEGSVKGFIQWGYSGTGFERKSQKMPFDLSGYNVAVGVNSFVLTIDGTFTHVEAVYNTTPMSGTLNQIITIFADRYNVDIDFDDDLVIQGGNSFLKGLSQDHTTELKEEEFHKQASESDFAFIKRILGKFVVDKQGKVGHPIYITHDPETSKTVLKIANKEKASRTITTNSEVQELLYVVQSPDSSVIEWAPELNFSSVTAMGGSNLVGMAIQAISGQDTVSAANEKLSDANIQHVQKGEFQPIFTPEADRRATIPTQATQVGENLDNRSSRIVAQPSRAPGAERIDVLNKHVNQRKNIKASLTLIGDPALVPDKTCTVIYNYPSSISRRDNTQKISHYSSGDYYVEQAIHTISAGLYTTVLELSRTKLYINPGERRIKSEDLPQTI